LNNTDKNFTGSSNGSSQEWKTNTIYCLPTVALAKSKSLMLSPPNLPKSRRWIVAAAKKAHQLLPFLQIIQINVKIK